MAEQRTATNPQTGEKVVFQNGQWVPLEQNPLQNVPGNPEQRPTSAIVADNATRTLLNNLMALPSATGDLLAGGAGLAQTIAETPFTEGGFGERLGANIEAQGQKFPANMLSAIPRPTVTDVTSAFRAAPALMPGGESFNAAFDREKAATQQARALEAEQRPMATGGGEMLGDVASLALGRQPFAKNLAEHATRHAPNLSQSTIRSLSNIAEDNPRIAAQIGKMLSNADLGAPGAQRLFRQVVNSGPIRSVIRGLEKGAEASLEGAVMAAVKGNDPVMNAGLAGGAQIGASMFSSIFGFPRSVRSLMMKAGGLAVLYRTAQEFTTGDNSLFDAADFSFNKLAVAITLGTVAEVTGGRLRNSEGFGRYMTENLPRFTDAINSVPRGALLSLANQIQKEQEEGTSLTLPTLELLSTNPSAFPDAVRNRLSRALDNGNLPQEVQRMRDIEEFTDALERR